MAKIYWTETWTTTTTYACELTDENLALYHEDQERFFEEVDFRGVGEVVEESSEEVIDYDNDVLEHWIED